MHFYDFLEKMVKEEKISRTNAVILRSLWNISYEFCYQSYNAAFNLNTTLNFCNNEDLCKILKDKGKEGLIYAVKESIRNTINSLMVHNLPESDIEEAKNILQDHLKLFIAKDYDCAKGMVAVGQEALN
jgi:hypothetical protein